MNYTSMLKIKFCKNAFFLLFFASLSVYCKAQPLVQWQKCLGGSLFEFPYSIQTTPDKGYIICGAAYSNNGDVIGSYGGGDFWVVKLDSNGVLQWQKPLGGSATETANDIQIASDGGYIIAGVTTSSNGLVTDFHGERDFWVVKLNSQGDLDWQKALGGSNDEDATSVTETNDGGFLVAGHTFSKDGNAQSTGFELFDIWVVKLDNTGNLLWEKRYGGNSEETACCIRKAKSGGYFLAGGTFSNDGNVSGNHGNEDFWVLKLNDEGNIIWQQTMGGAGVEAVQSLFATTDGGCVVIGTSGSINSGQVIGHHGMFDAWVVKLSSNGEIEWQKPFGGSNSDYGSSIIETSGSGYVFMGNTLSTNGDAVGHDGSFDVWIVRIDSVGTLLWQQNYGGSDFEGSGGIVQPEDQSFVFCADTRSNDGDVSGNHSNNEDFWIVKLSPESSATTETSPRPLGVWPNPATGPVRISTGESAGTLELALSDCTGKNILRLRMENNATTNLGALPDGLYFLQATDASGRRWLGKLIKQRE
ncbi:MAG: T9SS type A sorting domain-containing protein [Saprospiraceae bacterium]|nr:T9SS type A sorting domain-containing protein [Saprospiraceae bacterium]